MGPKLVEMAANGRLVIPRATRTTLGLREVGQQFAVSVESGSIKLTPVEVVTVDETFPITPELLVFTERAAAEQGPSLSRSHLRERLGRLSKKSSDKEDQGMAKKPVETYHEDGQWKSRREGSQRAFSVGGNKAEQTAQGRAAAKRDSVEHTIKKMDGTIGEKNSYGNDPHPPLG